MNNELQKQTELISYTPEQVALIKSQIAPKATDNELQLFLYQCKRTGLDPLTRQIYAIHRWTKDGDKMSIQTSIDGFRVIAERSGVYGGQDEPLFSEEGGKIINCKVTVYKFNNGVRYPAAVGVAYWNEYVQLTKDGKPSGLWAKMPHTMLAKVAEALALRKAFPQDLSGLYTGDEMEQATTVYEDVTPTQKKITIKEALDINEQIKDAIKKLDKCEDVTELSMLKATLSQEVIKSTSFHDASLKKYHAIVNHVNVE